MSSTSCPALFISAPGSGHGKTTITAALARFHVEQGRSVRVFKSGPDFLDPMILERASGSPVYQLDLWMTGKTQCRQLISQAALEADLILVEGVMGLFDGNPSSADLAELLNIPVLAVIDCKGTAQTAAAIAFGLANFRKKLSFAGFLANSIVSARHEEMIKEGIGSDIKYLGSIPRNLNISLPERHLGLVQANEINNIDNRLSNAAKAIAKTELAKLPAPVSFPCPEIKRTPELLAKVRIGIAKDAAFSFIYQANLDLLQSMGATLIYFSPLYDQTLPEVDSLFFPGGYPENHIDALQKNQSLKNAIKHHHLSGKPIYAECGGMLYLFEALTDKQGNKGEMVGILPGSAIMKNKIQGLGYQSVALPCGTLRTCSRSLRAAASCVRTERKNRSLHGVNEDFEHRPSANGSGAVDLEQVLRGHTFHHSSIQTPLQEFTTGERLFNTSPGEKVFLVKRLLASYLHLYFPSSPETTARLFLP